MIGDTMETDILGGAQLGFTPFSFSLAAPSAATCHACVSARYRGGIVGGVRRDVSRKRGLQTGSCK